MIYSDPKDVIIYPSKTQALEAYNMMLHNHSINIRKSYDKYGKAFAAALGVRNDDLESLIAVHDTSKMTNRDEINGYVARNFPYEGDNIPVSSYGLRRCIFEKGLLSHYHNNPHHPEYWIMIKNNTLTPMPMDAIYVCEMMLDWIANSINGKSDVKEYWKNNRNQKLIHHDTIDLIDKIINIVDDEEDITLIEGPYTRDSME